MINIVSRTDTKWLYSLCTIFFIWIGAYPNPSFAQSSLCGLNATIFDNSCTVSSNFPIVVSGLNNTQLGTDVILLEVHFIIAHTWDNDLDITLYSPSGVGVELSTDNGGGADHYGDPSDLTCSNYTSLSMNACLSIEDGIAPFIGNYIPEGNFNDFNDGSNPQGTWILQVCDDAASDMGSLHFVELIFAEMSCSPATLLSVDTLLDTSVSLSWEPGSNCGNTLLEYGPSGFLPGTTALAGEGILLNASCPVSQPFEINGLTDLTTYDIYIREQCENGGYSPNSCPLTVSTDCSTSEVTLLESFDGLTDCATSCGMTCPIIGTWFNSIDDDFDWLVDGGGTGSSNTGPSDDISKGGQYIYTEASGSLCRNGNEAMLQSECLLIDAPAGSCHLSFYYHMYGTDINELRLEVSTDAGINWTQLWSEVGNQGDTWWRNYIDLSAYNNKIATFRFVSIGGSGIRGDMALDEIAFFGATLVNDGGNIFYADQDGDTFGDANNTLSLCTEQTPSGYVANGNDCDDNNPSVSPSAMESPCNSIDENCDGILLQVLPELSATDQIVCMGSGASLTVNGLPVGGWFWFDVNGNALFEGDTFYTPTLTQSTVYWVQDSVPNTCSSPLKMITVTVDPGPNFGTNDQPTICLGEAFDLNSLNLVDASNNVVAISYHDAQPTNASNQLSSSLVQPNTTSTYFLRAATVNGCYSELAIDIIVNNTPTALIAAANNLLDICANDLTTITGSEGGTGTGQITYRWEDGATAAQRIIFPSNPTGPQTYTLQVTDANDCMDESNIVINTLPSITRVAITEVSDVDFCDGDNGFITLSPENGQAPFTFEWDGPKSGMEVSSNASFTMTGLTQGSYKVTISDSAGAGCDIFIPVIIINGPGVVVDPIIDIVPVTCHGGSNGSIDISVSGGTPTYLWSNGATSPDLQNIAAGNYSVTISESDCQTVLRDLQVPTPSALDATLAANHSVTCFGGSDGAIDVNITGGVGPYIYEWSNGMETEDINLLPEGEYQLTVTDKNNCTLLSQSITISQPTLLQIALDSVSKISCYNGADGKIDLSVSGGTTPYFFEWSNGLLTEDIQKLRSGIYEATVTDANDCSLNLTGIKVPDPNPLVVTVDALGLPTCNQILDGNIKVSTSGGTAPYTYAWNNGMLTEDLSGLPEGKYQLTVTDAKGCDFVTKMLEITAPEVLFFGLVFVHEESCMGVTDGAISVQILGGTPPYTYEWSNGQKIEDLTNLPAGDYQLTVSDMNGCSRVSPMLEVAALEPLAATVDLQEHVSCAGADDGSIYLSLFTNGMSYQYEWNNGAVTQDLQNIPPGKYSAKITANDGCTFFTPEITIEEPEPLELEVVSVESPTCNGVFDGSIDVSVTGGTTPYFYSWNNGTNEEDISGVQAGTYLLSVLDKNGCPVTTNTIEVNEPDALQMDILQIADVGCIDSIGNVSVEITGGTEPYNYIWSTGDTLPAIQKLPAGVYSLSVTDENNCFLVNSALEIDQLSDTLLVETNVLSPITCFGMSDAVLAAEITGGNYPFQYNWSNGITDSLNQDLSGGNYRVTVTDNYGCVGVSDFKFLASPPVLQYFVNEVVDNLCRGDDEGSISIVVSGGVSPYNLMWSNGEDSSYIDQLIAGAYSFTITDQNNCTQTTISPIQITEPLSTIQAQLFQTDSIACFGDMDASLLVIASGGAGGFQYEWNTGATTSSIDSLGPGFYQCAVTDVNDCRLSLPGYIIEGPEAPLSVLMSSSQVIDNKECDGMAGAISLEVSGGTLPYHYLWSNGSLTENIVDLPSGNYLVTVTDFNDCVTESETFIIEEPENTLVANMMSTPDTNSLSSGTATFVVTGGKWPYSFEWDSATSFQTDSIATDLAAGQYRLTITDANQCTLIEEVLVETITVIIDAVDEANSFGLFRYYPNPVNDFLTIEIELLPSSDVVVRLRTILGQPIKHITRPETKQERIILDLKQLPSGPYLLELELNGKKVIQEFIIRH